MIYDVITNLIYKGLQEEYDDPIIELIDIFESLDDGLLATHIKHKIEEVCEIKSKCPHCGSDLTPNTHMEIHEELDSFNKEVFITYRCRECGYINQY